ncbi:hypothetical protein GCM10027285_14170 [Oleiagrimonas citrea]|uniref:Uncharacterized protein n=1 Tax=Oleiagrimonas citrea TaxID=1665687 RepID=A0A846ZP90_9GAMM|nr:hypothetical protein [Oleiagrimonas citrea]NKZ40085.1 hypothetical protein [Oleiagrimonas citrea]
MSTSLRKVPVETTPSTARPWWRRLLVPLALAVLAVLVLSPEFAFLGVFLDAAVLDVLLMMLGMQLLLFRDQWWSLARSGWAAMTLLWRNAMHR